MAKQNKKEQPKTSSNNAPVKVITVNRQAYHDYYIERTIEAGIALKGTEIKSIRDGKVNLRGSYAIARNGELWLENAHIAVYEHGNRYNHEPMRSRKLLLHRREIDRLFGQVVEKGLTVVPLRLYFKGGRVKAEIAVVRGKKLFDKRESEKRRELDREAAAAVKQR